MLCHPLRREQIDQDWWIMRMVLQESCKRHLRHGDFIKFRSILLSIHKIYICATTHTLIWVSVSLLVASPYLEGNVESVFTVKSPQRNSARADNVQVFVSEISEL
jgi:hypothetical protein